MQTVSNFQILSIVYSKKKQAPHGRNSFPQPYIYFCKWSNPFVIKRRNGDDNCRQCYKTLLKGILLQLNDVTMDAQYSLHSTNNNLMRLISKESKKKKKIQITFDGN